MLSLGNGDSPTVTLLCRRLIANRVQKIALHPIMLSLPAALVGLLDEPRSLAQKV